jgi:Domain of unknown function (DUF6458)
MTLGGSLFLIAVGAILAFAIKADIEGVKLETVGVILMMIGAVGLVISLFWMTPWSRRRRGLEPEVARERPTEVIREREYR